MAGGLSAHRAPWLLFVLRSLHPHHRFDVQPACEVAEGHERYRVASAHRVAELPADFPRVAAGPQRLHPPGPGLHRSRGKQESRRRARVSASRRELPALCRRSLPAQPQLCERDRRGKTDRKSTRLNSSHMSISYAVFCLKKKKKKKTTKKINIEKIINYRHRLSSTSNKPYTILYLTDVAV